MEGKYAHTTYANTIGIVCMIQSQTAKDINATLESKQSK